MSAKKSKGKSVLLRILLLSFAIYVSVTLIKLQINLINVKQELKERESYLKETTIKVEELTRLLEEGDEKELIEKAARERLGYVYPNEQVFIDPSGN